METSTPSPHTTVVKVLLFTDIVGSTDLKRRMGDAEGARAIALHDSFFRECLVQFGGEECDHAGDGFFATFDRPSDALRCALAFQSGLSRIEFAEAPRVRVGIHMGEIVRIADGGTGHGRDKLVGLAVDTAARIMSLAEGGQILLSRSAFDSARQQVLAAPNGSLLTWLAHGPYLFKGIDEPTEIHEAGIASFSPLRPPPDSEKARRAVSAGDEITLGWQPGPGLEIPHRPNWVLSSKLGEGGFGEVWLGEHKKTKDRRVFKFCYQADRLRGLKREVVLFRLLKETLGDRDDIARIIDWQFDEAPFFIEAEYTQGGDLAEWAAAQGGIATVPLEVRLEIVAQTAEALAAAHSVGVLHKDIKPSNILIAESPPSPTPPLTPISPFTLPTSPFPKIRLTDFGIGLITDRTLLAQRGITATGLTMTQLDDPSSSRSGTRLYVAPEVLEGKPATSLSDIYALGVMLYQMTCGDFAHALAPGWERDIADDFLREDIAVCVDGSPTRRIGSAGELAERLRNLGPRRAKREAMRIAGEEADKTRELAFKVHRRRKQLILVGILAALITIAVSAVALRENRRAQDQTQLRRDADEARLEAEKARALAENALQTAKYEQYVTNIRFAQSCLAQGRVQTAVDTLLKTPEHLRNWEWGFLMEKTFQKKSRSGSVDLVGHTDVLQAVAFSPRGDRVATGSSDGSVRVWDATSGRPLVSMMEGNNGTFKFPVHDVDFSPDGKNILVAIHNGTPKIWDSETGQFLRALSGPADVYRIARYNPAGSKIVTVSNKTNNAAVWDAATGLPEGELSGHSNRVEAARFSPDGNRIVTASLDKTARVWNTATLREMLTLDKHAGPVYDVEFSPDGTKIVTSSDDGTARIWDAVTGNELAVFAAHGAEVRRASFSPDGMRVASCAGTIALTLDPVKKNGAAALASLSDGVKIWDAINGNELVTLDGYYPSFGPDGSRIAVLNYRDARLWDTVPWNESALPGDSSMDWNGRFALWRREHNRSWDPQPIENAGAAIFEDDFQTGESLARWTWSDDWEIAQGRLRSLPPSTPSYRISIIQSGLFDLDNYAIETRVEMSPGSRFSVMVRCQYTADRAFRGIRPYKCIVFVLDRIHISGQGLVETISNGEKVAWAMLPKDVFKVPPFRGHRDWKKKDSFLVRVEARGRTIRAFIDGDYAGEIVDTDNEYSTGSFGFANYMGDDIPSALYDNIAIYPLAPPE